MEFAFTKFSGDLVTNTPTLRVWLWDTGPIPPIAPARPKPPKGQEGDPEYDLAMIDFREQMHDYEKALLNYRRAKEDHADWFEKYKGPFEFRQWSCDARVSLERDPKRYFVSSRNPGWEKTKNLGLPKGMEPGEWHYKNQERIAAGEADEAEERRQDPVFGSLEARA
jgi:hypothetical protein